MRIVIPSVQITQEIDGDAVLRHLEKIGRLCYNSLDRIEEGSAEKFLKNIIKHGHESILENYSISVQFSTSRAIANQIVRHRLASFAQASTRYIDFSKEKNGKCIDCVLPLEFFSLDLEKLVGLMSKEDAQEEIEQLADKEKTFIDWAYGCYSAEAAYFRMIEHGCKAEVARDVLPLCLATELSMTANIREWRHFFNLRCDKAAHPDIRYLSTVLLDEMSKRVPVLFDDLVEKYL